MCIVKGRQKRRALSAVFPVWAGLVLTDELALAGRALFSLNATTLVLASLAN
jgi:hypothetical protein